MQRLRAILTLIAAIAFFLSPILSSGFNGFSPGQFPIPQVDPPVQPAGYAFSIWGLIYLALLAGAVYGLFRRANDALDETHLDARDPLCRFDFLLDSELLTD